MVSKRFMDITQASSITDAFDGKNTSYALPPLNQLWLNDSSCKPFQSDGDLTRGVKISCYCVVLLFSLLGNSLLIAIIKKKKRKQTITNYLIANMAVSDIIITVLAVPRQITEILLGPRRWLVHGLLGSILCKSLSFLQDTSTEVSILSLVVIAIDRYRGIVFPIRRQLIKPARLYKVIIPLICITSMGLHAVYFYIFRIVTEDTKTYCAMRWSPKFDERSSQKTYYFIILVFVILIPTCIVTTLYSAIILNLKRSKPARSKGPSSCVTPQRLREDMKVMRMIIAIFIAFLVCIIPINFYGLMFYYVWDWTIPCGIENFGFAAHFMLYSNPSINPIIYIILNDKYRKGLRDILEVFHVRRKFAAVESKSAKLETSV